MNLQDIYYNIQDILITLYDYDYDNIDSSYRKTLLELENNLSALYKYFCIKKLKIDINDFNKGEIVIINQDESGTWMSTLDNKKCFCLDECNINPIELFED